MAQQCATSGASRKPLKILPFCRSHGRTAILARRAGLAVSMAENVFDQVVVARLIERA